MSTMPMYLLSPETEWALACESVEASHAPRGSRARQIAVNVLGWTLIAGGAAVAAWMLTSTPARGPIESWSTMGSMTPALAATSEVEDFHPGAPGLAATLAGLGDAGAPGRQGACTFASDREAADAGAPEGQMARVAASDDAAPDAGAPVVAPKARVALQARVAPKARISARPHRNAARAKADAADDPYTEAKLQELLKAPVEENPYDLPPVESAPYRPTEP